MLTADFSQIVAEMDTIIARMHENASFLEAVGEREALRAQERIRDTKTDPLDRLWAPWSPFTRSEREHKGNADLGLLFDEGDLLMSIHPEVSALSNSVEIGSNLDYAADLQNGTDRMPAREFLGWGKEAALEYENLFIHYLETGGL